MKPSKNLTRWELMILLILVMVLMSGCSNSSTNETKGSTVSAAPTATAVIVNTETPTATPTSSPTATVTVTASPTPKPTSVPTPDVEPNGGMFDPWFEAYTGVAYSSGTDSEWAYGNQRKEFTSSRPCYVRISNSVVAPWHWGYVYGLGNKITITYRFTGTANCQVDVSDGFLTKVETNDPNVIEYTRVIEAKASREDNNVVVFQYTPSGAGSISLEIVYDSQVNSKYDVRSTIYFVDSEW